MVHDYVESGAIRCKYAVVSDEQTDGTAADHCTMIKVLTKSIHGHIVFHTQW